MSWALLGGGAVLAAAGTTVAVAAAAVSRVELYRWISQRQRAGGSAGALLAVPRRILGAANGLAALGCLVSASGLVALVAPLPLPAALAAALVIGVPAILAVGYGAPRAVGRRWAEPIVKAAVPVLDRLAILLAPLVPGRAESRPKAALAALLESDDDSLETEEALSVLSGVLAFTERPVREIMTPRTEIVAVREGASLDEVGRLFAESGYSRVPVYRESLDDIIGMYYALDFFKVSPGAELPVRPVAVAPGSKQCADLLFEMQRERHQFAVLLDEYGGTAGIATFQDLLGELVEEIFNDTHAAAGAASDAVELAEVTGATPSEDLEARFEVTLPARAETVGGLLARAAGRIPQAGERFVLGDLEFDVLEATPVRVERVVVRRGAPPPVHLGGGTAP